ncbi:MAG: dedA [Candidatus Saccharibacteria bacterium]|nr:dedA [Candidatus Saccharibacteria bacterium]
MLNVTHLIQAGGLPLLAFILYAEAGLFLGFFLPGDTLLIAAGIYAHQGHLPILGVIIVAAIAAILGDNTGYFIGRKLGPAVFTKPDGVIFNKSHINTSEKFFERYGAKTLLVSHFLPIVRSFTPLLAGVGQMEYRRFVLFNTIGDISWAVSITLVGYYVGSRIPNIDTYILIIIGAAIAFSVLPAIYHAGKLHLRRRAAKRDQ